MNKKSKLAIFLLSMAIAGSTAGAVVTMTGCGKKPNEPPVDASISLNESNVTLNVGEELTLNVIKTGIEGELTYFWSSTDEAVISVVNGKIMAVGAGTATVSVVSGEYSAECNITVVALSIKLSTNAMGLYEGKSGTVSADVVGKNGDNVSAEFNWTVKDGENVTMDVAADKKSVTVTADNVGITILTVTAVVNGQILTKDIIVSVSDKYYVSASQNNGLTPNGAAYDLALGYDYDKDDIPKEWTINGMSVYAFEEIVENAQIVYSSNNESVAKIEGGKIIATGQGNCLVTGTYTDSDNQTVNVFINVKVDEMFVNSDIYNDSDKAVILEGLSNKYYYGQNVSFKVKPVKDQIIYSVYANGALILPDADNKYNLPYEDGIVIHAETDLGLAFKTTKAQLNAATTDYWNWLQLNDGTIVQTYCKDNEFKVKLIKKDWTAYSNSVGGTITGEDIYILIYRTIDKNGNIEWSLYASGTPEMDIAATLHITAQTGMNSLANPYNGIEFHTFGSALVETDEIEFTKVRPEFNVTAQTEHVTLPGLASSYKYGDIAKFTVSVEDGYELDYVKIGENILIPDDEGYYTYTVYGAFTVEASAVEIPEERNLKIIANDALVTDENGNAFGATVKNAATLKFKVEANAGHTLYFVQVNGVKVEPVDGVYSVEVNSDTTIFCGTEAVGVVSICVPVSGMKDTWQGFWIYEGTEVSSAEKTYINIRKNGAIIALQILDDGMTNVGQLWPALEGLTASDKIYIYVYRTVSETGAIVYTVYASKTPEINISTTPHVTGTTSILAENKAFLSYAIDKNTLFEAQDFEITFDKTKVEYTATSSGANATVTGLKEKYNHGETATFKVTVATGYELVSVKVGDTVLTADGEGNYSYKPTANFAVTVEAREIPADRTITVISNDALVTDENGNAFGATVKNATTLKFKVEAKTGHTLHFVQVNGVKVEPVNGVYSVEVNSDITIFCGTEAVGVVSICVPVSGMKDSWQGFWIYEGTEISSAKKTYVNIRKNGAIIALQILDDGVTNVGQIWPALEGLTASDNIYIYVYRTISENGAIVYTVYASKTAEINSYTTPHVKGETTISAENIAFLSYEIDKNTPFEAEDTQITYDATKIEYTATSSGANATVMGLKDKYEYGETATFKVTVATGYELVSVKVGDTVLTADGEGNYTYKPTADFAVTVEAKEIPAERAITVTSNNASVTAEDGGDLANTIQNGETLKFKVTATTGHELYFVRVNGEIVEATDGVYSVTATSDIAIVAETDMCVASIKVTLKNGWQNSKVYDGNTFTYINMKYDGGNLPLQIKNGSDELIKQEWPLVSNLSSNTVYLYVLRTVEGGKIVYTAYASETASINSHINPSVKATTAIDAATNTFVNYDYDQLTVEEVDISFDTSIPEYTATSSGANATVTGLEEKYNYGETATFKVTVATGYELVSVKVGDTVLTADSEGNYTYKPTANFAVTVETKEIPAERTITVTANNATVTAEDGGALASTIQNGETLKFKVTATTGHELYFVRVNGEIVEATDGVYSVTATSDIAIYVETDMCVASLKVTLKTDGGWQGMYLKDGDKSTYVNLKYHDNACAIQSTDINDWNGFTGLQSNVVYIYVLRTVNGEGKIVYTIYLSNTASMNKFATANKVVTTTYDAQTYSFTELEKESGMTAENTDISFNTVMPEYTATSSGANATVTGLKEKYNHGETATFKVTVATGYELVSVKVGDTVLTADGEGNYSYKPTADFAVTVETREIPAARNITVTTNNSTLTTEDGSALGTTIANGETLKFKVAATEGHEVYFVKVNGTVVTATDNVYSVEVTEDIAIYVETDRCVASLKVTLKDNWQDTELIDLRGSTEIKTVVSFKYANTNLSVQVKEGNNVLGQSWEGIKGLSSNVIYLYIVRTVKDGKIVYTAYVSESNQMNSDTVHAEGITSLDATENEFKVYNPYGITSEAADITFN